MQGVVKSYDPGTGAGVVLCDTDLSEYDLSETEAGAEATPITYEQLEQDAKSLKGATMPNGQKYEDWLKDKNAQAKDEKNE